MDFALNAGKLPKSSPAAMPRPRAMQIIVESDGSRCPFSIVPIYFDERSALSPSSSIDIFSALLRFRTSRPKSRKGGFFGFFGMGAWHYHRSAAFATILPVRLYRGTVRVKDIVTSGLVWFPFRFPCPCPCPRPRPFPRPFPLPCPERSALRHPPQMPAAAPSRQWDWIKAFPQEPVSRPNPRHLFTSLHPPLARA